MGDVLTDAEVVRRQVAEVAAAFAADRRARQARTTLDPADFNALRAAGLQRVGLPAERGGLWSSARESTREIAEIYRALASGDSSVALVSAMHVAVLAFWLGTEQVEAPHTASWQAQRSEVFDTVEAGCWWGTITSEPGSGGDVAKTRSVATCVGAEANDWRITGEKHFGSGAGIVSYMITTALPQGSGEPDWFFIPVAQVPFDGSAGITLTAPWDGHGMTATQSHGFSFDIVPAQRIAWPGHLQDVIGAAGPFFGLLFTAVVLGIVETAVREARIQLSARKDTLRPFEQVEWAQAELEAWTMEQAYEGALRTLESGQPARGASLRAKTVSAQLAESCLQRICRVMGGGTFGRRSPFGHWFEDVRALGFLRPPWALAFDGLVAESLVMPE